MINDFFVIFYWWFLLFGLGITGLFLTSLLFKNFIDFGYPFAKILSILLLSYIVWITGSLHFLPFSFTTVWIAVIALFLISFLVGKKSRAELIIKIKVNWQLLVFEEFIFLTALMSWSYIRGFQPDIDGLEKFMDFGFINSILKSQYFPPADMWFAGKTINYYYFGHLVAAVLTKISGINSPVSYNLMIGTVFALAFSASFSLVMNITHAALMPKIKSIHIDRVRIFRFCLIAGIVSAILFTLGGNLHTLWWFLTHNFNFNEYWYPDATRFIVEKFGAADNTIHEFPIYSFVVSDLHGHVSDIPFVLLFLGLLLSFLLRTQTKLSKLSETKNLALNFELPIALVLSVMYMTNSWDFPIYFLIFCLVLLLVNYQNYGLNLKFIYTTALASLFTLLASILFSLPFHLHFNQIAQGVDSVHAHSPYWQLLVLWGYQWLIAIPFVALILTKNQLIRGRLSVINTYVLILLGVATLLIIIPEIIYVKDIYIASYHRANTIFKLVYQSFVLYALASGYIVIFLWLQLQKKWFKYLLFTFYFLLFNFVLVYPYFAIKSYYHNLNGYQGLYGLHFLQKTYPDDFAAIDWLNQNINDQPVVLEAVGDSYTDFGRVSMTTGFPTIEGWLVHEWLWRGSFEEPGKRATEVETIYTSKDISITRSLLRKYHVRYIFVGTKEREKYTVYENKFNVLGSPVFESGNTKIYFLDKLNNQ